MAALGSASSFAASTQKGTEGEALFAPALMSSKTRADVQAGYFQALKAGQLIAMTEGTVLVGPAFMSVRSVNDVRAEAVMAAHHPLNTGTLQSGSVGPARKRLAHLTLGSSAIRFAITLHGHAMAVQAR